MHGVFFKISDMMKQGLSLARKPHVVIATPGRLADHLAHTDTVSFKRVRFLVRETHTYMMPSHTHTYVYMYIVQRDLQCTYTHSFLGTG